MLESSAQQHKMTHSVRVKKAHHLIVHYHCVWVCESERESEREQILAPLLYFKLGLTRPVPTMGSTMVSGSGWTFM